jgi:DNA-binding response OmpR family regulator
LKELELRSAITHLSRDTEAVFPILLKLQDKPQITELLLVEGGASLIIVEANDLCLIDSLQSIEKKELAVLNQVGQVARLAPLVAVFSSPEVLSDVRDLPELISDWVFLPIQPCELARRIFSALKRKNIIRAKLLYGALSLNADSRSLQFFEKSIHMTRSEYALLELFLSQMGTVIPLTDLAMLFRATGKSTEGSNIRVTIFQLRLKLEMLTKGQYTVVSVYKQGYCLKQKARSTLKEISDGLDARQRASARYVS